MKKHDEGYVLVLVLVVVIVLCLVASAILSGALYNINSQHAQIEKMKEQYAAEGMIEILVSRLEDETEWNFSDVDTTNFNAVETEIISVASGICTELKKSDTELIMLYSGEDDDPENPRYNTMDGKFIFTVISRKGDSVITAKMVFQITGIPNTVQSKFTSYESYHVDTITEEVPE